MKVPSQEEQDPVSLCTGLTEFLLEEIAKVQSFKTKWGLIKTKLTDLKTQLSDFKDLSASTLSSPLSLDLLHSVSHTLNDAVLLAEICEDSVFTQGKLKTQSDIDFILAQLDSHVRDADVLIKSGVLSNDVVSGSSSKREVVRAESRNLITRLQIGSIESRNSAMDSLLGLLHEEDKNVMIAVAQGVVPVLVRLLDCSSFDMKEKAVTAIARVSMVESSKHVLIAEGLLLLNHLLRVLESGSGFAKEKACLTLQVLSFTKENARAIGSRGGICSLLEICLDGTPGSQAFAAGVLRNLAGIHEIRDNFVEESAVGVLVGLAGSGTVLARENAIGCLSNLVKDDENLKLLVVKEGGVECLKNFWDSCASEKSLEVAVELLRQLGSSQAIAEALTAEEFIGRVIGALSSGILGVRIAAAKAVYEFSFSMKTRKEMGEFGCISPLISMMDGKSAEEKEAAAMALSSLVLYAANKRIFRREENGIVSAVRLLEPLVLNVDKKYPISLLHMLVHSKKCRKQMVAAGACGYLKKLVEIDVEGAKKLLDALSRGKIWGVFGRW